MFFLKFLAPFILTAALVQSLPDILNEIRRAQIYLVIESRSTSWGKPWVPD